MMSESEAWLSVDDLFDAKHPRQVFSGAQSNPAQVTLAGGVAPLSLGEFRRRWRELTEAAHHDLERCAALLDVLVPLPLDARIAARSLERGCDRLAQDAAVGTAEALLPRACVLAGLTGRLIRDAYDYANVRVVMGGALIGYQLVCAKLADMAIVDEIIEQRLMAALDAPSRPRTDTGWRGVPALTTQAHIAEIARCVAVVLNLYVEIHAGHAFVQRAVSAPVLAVAQTLLEGIQAVRTEEA